ncbi:hypothetical protein STEG23_013904, partial [Scotinomys teguina]
MAHLRRERTQVSQAVWSTVVADGAEEPQPKETVLLQEPVAIADGDRREYHSQGSTHDECPDEGLKEGSVGPLRAQQLLGLEDTTGIRRLDLPLSNLANQRRTPDPPTANRERTLQPRPSTGGTPGNGKRHHRSETDTFCGSAWNVGKGMWRGQAESLIHLYRDKLSFHLQSWSPKDFRPSDTLKVT